MYNLFAFKLEHTSANLPTTLVDCLLLIHWNKMYHYHKFFFTAGSPDLQPLGDLS